MASEAAMFNTITDPETDKVVELNSAIGQQIIKNWHILKIFKINSLFIRVYLQHSYMNNNKGDNL